MNVDPTPQERRRQIIEALDAMAWEGHHAAHCTEEGKAMRGLRIELAALGGEWQHPDLPTTADTGRWEEEP